MGLKEYRKKRDFKKTREPSGSGKSKILKKTAKKSGRLFVIQKHAASHLHYDFRLEYEGVLKSWAVPKGPSLDPQTKRLAVEVEDHPLSYANFEGDIPADEYGGGEVIVWDTGEWIPKSGKTIAEMFEHGHIEFTLEGEKLQGGWALVRTKRSTSNRASPKHQWLLFKRTDEFARPQGPEMIDERPESVISGKLLPLDQAAKPVKATAKVKKKAQSLPRKVSPQLARLVDKAPAGSDWVHEIKFDGYRLIARIENGKVRLITRNGHDWTDHYRPVADALKKLKTKSTILDGEVVWLDPDGRTSFQHLQNALETGKTGSLVYFAFDCLFRDGEDLRDRPFLERKEALKELLESSSSDRVRISEHWSSSGEEMLKAACGLKFEGIISKKADAPYIEGRGPSWVKTKCIQTQEFVIVGYTESDKARVGFRALLLGAKNADGALQYTGKVGTGFDNRTLLDIKSKLRKIEQDETSLEANVPRERAIHWVKPKYVAQIQFGEFTNEGILRHPSFLGLREDKNADQVFLEVPVKTETIVKKAGSRKKSKKQTSRLKVAPPKSLNKGVQVAGVTLSNPDRVLFPDSGLTKRQVAEFYESIEKWIVPHVVKRPLAIVRCPEGEGGECFFQKHLHFGEGKDVHEAKLNSKERGKNSRIIYVDDLRGVIQLVQMGTLEIHRWNSTVKAIDYPEQFVLDFDPDPGVKWDRVREAAFEAKDILDQLGLESWVKVTGGKGLHVQVPIEAKYEYEKVKEFSHAIARLMAKRAPENYTAELMKKHRTNKIFVDYLRNGFGATAIVPYSLRNKPNASVAVPISWKELKSLDEADGFTLQEAEKFLRKRKDPWADYFETRQRIAALDGRKSKMPTGLLAEV
jgi:bifunctional non-homologous end joining protein LigD